jgi:hypothetical protein
MMTFTNIFSEKENNKNIKIIDMIESMKFAKFMRMQIFGVVITLQEELKFFELGQDPTEMRSALCWYLT